MNINLFVRCDLTALCGLLLVFFVALGASSSHWIITDGGLKINALPDSPFHMEQSHSLVEFLEQEKAIEGAYKNEEFLQQLRETAKKGIYEDDPDLEEKFRKHDHDCRTSANFPFNTDNFASSYVVDIYELMGQSPKLSLELSKASPDFSPLCALPEYYKSDHFKQRLRCFESRKRMHMKADFKLRDLLPEHTSDQFVLLGGALHNSMQQYPRDPVLAYYAMLFWRVRGNATNAVDCLLRHLYLSQLESSDITAAGFALGNLLVKLGCYNESIPYLLNTVSAFPDNPDIRSAYADALALSGNHSQALEIYNDVFRRHPSRLNCAMKAAALRCHIKLIGELEKQHTNLIELVSLAHRYSDRFDFVDSLEPEVKAKLASREKRFQSSLLYDHFTYGPFKQLKCPAVRFFEKYLEQKQDKLVCTLRDTSAFSKDLVRRHVERVAAVKAKNAKSEEKNEKPKEWWDEDAPTSNNLGEVMAFFKTLEPFAGMKIDEPSYPKKYPLEAEPLTRIAWPNRTFCDRQKRRGVTAPSSERLPQMFMSVDNKGFVTADFFTKYLRLLSENDVHPLPWNKPTCNSDFSVKKPRIPAEAEEGVSIALKTQRKRARFVEAGAKTSFLALSGSEMHLSVGDIGQRIRTLQQMAIAPDWMTSNWAALFWRVNGAPDQAVACLLHALNQEDQRFDDIALVQLAQLVMATAPNHTDSASALLEKALKVDDSEPMTHYLLGVLELIRNRIPSALRRFMDAVKRDTGFAPAHEALLSARCTILTPRIQVKDRFPPESCSLAERTLYCTRKKKRRICYKVEYDSDYKASLVYHRCVGQPYLSKSDAVPGLFQILSPLLFSIEDIKRENRLLAHQKKASSAFETQSGKEDGELPLDYAVKDESQYYSPNRGDQFHRRPRKVVFNPDAYVPSNVTSSSGSSDALEEEWFEEVVRYEPGVGNLNFDDINDVKKVLFLDVPLPEVHAEPPEEMVRKGAFYFRPPTASTFHDFCAVYKKGSTFLDHIPSTWVSVTAKGVDYENYIDFTTPVAGHGQYEPECPDLDAPSPIESLDHLPPSHVRDRLNKFYKPEKVLTDALKSMAHEMERIEHVAARLHIAMRVSRLQPMNENQAGGVHWTLTTASTLYWRVKGDAVNAMKCLRHSLNNAPPDMRDVALVSMANIYQNTGFLHSAIISASAAYRISPHLVVTHITLANIYAALADYERALKFYYSTLSIQSNFKPAKQRIRAIYCQTGMTYNLFPGIKH